MLVLVVTEGTDTVLEPKELSELRLQSFCRFKLRELFCDRGWSQRRIGEQIGVSREIVREVIYAHKTGGPKVQKGLTKLLYGGNLHAFDRAAEECWNDRRCLWHDDLAHLAKSWGKRWNAEVWSRVFEADAYVYEPDLHPREWAQLVEYYSRARRPIAETGKLRAVP